ncbi:hypothetical protein tb265_24420 [Gemmatimonadetes bacterium T265]|nr:hypothetical protein tb265_24420 [Gemmatimonadetes bacterium T265]
MLTIVRLFLLRRLAARTLGGVVAGALGAAISLAVVLKFVGLPFLGVVALAGAPVGIVLAVLRLPIRIVLGAVSVVGGLAAAAFAVGVFAVKLALAALVFWLLVRWYRRRPREVGPVVTGAVM